MALTSKLDAPFIVPLALYNFQPTQTANNVSVTICESTTHIIAISMKESHDLESISPSGEKCS